MNRVVELLVTVRPGGSLDLSALTLRSVRVGFPTAALVVWGNDLPTPLAAELARRVTEVGGHYFPLAPQRHDYWLAWRIDQTPADELVILDGDLIFHRDVEDLPALAPLTGPHEPRHFNPHTGALHHPRLHTCFLRIQPPAVRRRLAEYRAALPRIPHAAPWHPTAQVWVPGQPPEFWDTAAQLARVVPSTGFNPDYDDAFTHLHAGTWAAELAGIPSLAHLPDLHRLAVAGALTDDICVSVRATQRRWYDTHAQANKEAQP